MPDEITKVYVIEMDRYADAGVATGPVFLSEDEAEEFIDRYAPRFTAGDREVPDWSYYELPVVTAATAAEWLSAAQDRFGAPYRTREQS